MVRVSRLNGWSSASKIESALASFRSSTSTTPERASLDSLGGGSVSGRSNSTEAGAVAQFAAQADLAAHQVYQASADVQPQAAAGRLAKRRRADLREWPEQPGLVLLRNTEAGVAYLEQQMKPLRLAPPHRPHRYPSALGELDGIAQQVEQHLLEMQGIHQHPVLEIPVEFQCQEDSSAASAHQPTAGFL